MMEFVLLMKTKDNSVPAQKDLKEQTAKQTLWNVLQIVVMETLNVLTG